MRSVSTVCDRPLEETRCPPASDNLCERLIAWGVTTIYGYPGDGIDGSLGALQRRQEKLRFIQVRHEETAAFVACAHAKYTGEVGVCTATSGPGAIHLLNGLFDAKLDHVPVVAIVGQTFSLAARVAVGNLRGWREKSLVPQRRLQSPSNRLSATLESAPTGVVGERATNGER